MNLLESHIEGAQEFNPKERGLIYRAIIEYLYYGYEPDYLQGASKGYFIAIKPSLDKSNARKEAGRKGGQANIKQNGSKRQANNKQTAKQNESDSDSDSEELSNDNSNPIVPYGAVIDYLNEKAGTSYRARAAKSMQHIRARWAEGYRLEDFRRVIDVKVAEWKNDPKMARYLRPETLFGTKFEGYLNQPQPRKAVKDYAKYDR